MVHFFWTIPPPKASREPGNAVAPQEESTPPLQSSGGLSLAVGGAVTMSAANALSVALANGPARSLACLGERSSHFPYPKGRQLPAALTLAARSAGRRRMGSEAPVSTWHCE